MTENKDKKISELFEELKGDLVFLPDIDAVKEGYLFGLKYQLLQ